MFQLRHLVIIFYTEHIKKNRKYFRFVLFIRYLIDNWSPGVSISLFKASTRLHQSFCLLPCWVDNFRPTVARPLGPSLKKVTYRCVGGGRKTQKNEKVQGVQGRQLLIVPKMSFLWTRILKKAQCFSKYKSRSNIFENKIIVERMLVWSLFKFCLRFDIFQAFKL